MVNVVAQLCAHEQCSSTSRAFGMPGQKGTHCKKHLLPGMVNMVNKLCEHVGCLSTSRAFDVVGGKGRFCKDHALSTMINVVSVRCTYSGCEATTRNFDVPGGKGLFCKAHAESGMVDVRNAACIIAGCDTRANFSMKGQPAQYCSKHKRPGMCNRQACEHDQCMILAGCNYPGHTNARFCSAHKLNGMINVRVRMCQHPGCKKSASFATTGSPMFCKTHADDTMRNVFGKLCEHEGCETSANYNMAGQRPKFCMKHSEKGMVCAKGKGCQHPGCQCRSRYFDIPGGKGRFCTKHKEPGMVDVMNPKCIECDTLASYGIPGGKRTACSRHRKPGMLSRPRAKCVVCKKPALYGKSFIPRHCEAHKESDDDNLMERSCVSCNLVMVLDAQNKCEFCDSTRFETNRLAKQNALMEYLNGKGLRGNSTDIVIDKGVCGKERPDRVFDFDDKVVVLECDEHQHRERACSCEQTRMVNISQSYGGTPVYFIRWNPDNYTSVDGRLPDPVAKRHQLVARFLRDIRDNRIVLPTALLSTFYMYYDDWNGIENETWRIITPFA